MKFPSFGGKKFTCGACGEKFKKEEELHEHERKVHVKGR
jgi:uncharacterized protein (DUF2225 family)